MADPTSVDNSVLIAVVNKILDWPLLLFILCLILMFKGGQTVIDLIKSRKIDVDIGGNKISIGDALQALDEQSLGDFKKLQQEIGPLKSRIELLEAHTNLPATKRRLSGEFGRLVTANIDLQQSDRLEADRDAATKLDDLTLMAPQAAEGRNILFKRMLGDLAGSKFTWRTVERLAAGVGISEPEAREILAEHPDEVVFGTRQQSGQTLVRLASRNDS